MDLFDFLGVWALFLLKKKVLVFRPYFCKNEPLSKLPSTANQWKLIAGRHVFAKYKVSSCLSSSLTDIKSGNWTKCIWHCI